MFLQRSESELKFARRSDTDWSVW